MTTMQQLVDEARRPINDDDKIAWADDELLAYANRAISMLKSRRPDLFFGSFTALPGVLALSGTFPLEDQFLPAVVDYVTARAQFKDSEEAVKGAASAFYQLFDAGI
jgi:hypothetical protein